MKKPTHDELVKMLPTNGWHHTTGTEAAPQKPSTLEQLVRASHARHKRGEDPGLISQIENSVELDLIQLQQLWMHLGLPT